MSDGALLELRNAGVRVGDRALLGGVTLSVAPGEFVALVGPNGAGKTTLLRAALGLVRLEAGEVMVGGRRIDAVPPRKRASLLGWLPQQALASEPLSALETVVAARYRFDETRVTAREQALRALGRLGALELAERPVTRLSGGEQQRVALAALVAQEARVLLVDEPANHLDPAQQAETYALLAALVREGMGVLCVTHDVNLLAYAAVAPSPVRVVGLASGGIAFETRYDAPELPERLAALFGVPMHAVMLGARRIVVPVPRTTAGDAP
ncbi:MAG TPA: ABC transporter ATP-binding protein [Polyangiaceae bacterium]